MTLNCRMGIINPPRKKAMSFPDLFTHIARCEINYLRLRKLLHEPASGLMRSRTIEFEAGAPAMKFEHTYVSRYTSLVSILQATADALPHLDLRLKVYHDTKATEVVAYQRHQDFRVLEVQPKLPRTHQFEKIEMNRFLGELLDHCLTNGTLTRSVTASKKQGSSINS